MNKCSSAQNFKPRFHACPQEVTMKKSKDVTKVANAGSAVAAAKPDFSLIDESLLKSWLKKYIYLLKKLQ